MKRTLSFTFTVIAAVGCSASRPAAPRPTARPLPLATASAVASASASPGPTNEFDDGFQPGAGFGTNVRAVVQPKPFDIKTLPLANIPEPLPPSSAPFLLPAGEEPAEIVFDRPTTIRSNPGVRVGISYRSVGRIRIGFSEGALGDPTATGVFITCGGPSTGSRHALPARWETLRASTGGHATYAVANAWFDPVQCKAIVVARALVEAAPIAGGAMFAFRQSCAACAGGETLVVLAPRATRVTSTALGGDSTAVNGPFTRVLLPLRRGGGGAVMESVAAASWGEWQDLFGVTHGPPVEMILGVELTQVVSDPAPIAVAYAGSARPDRAEPQQVQPQQQLAVPR